MKGFLVLPLLTSALLAGCAGTDVNSLVTAGTSLAQAATLTDAEVKSLSDQACAESDQTNKTAGPRTNYAKRLTKVMAGLKNSDVPNLNVRVYLTKDVNAWAMANGCVRVYSGLMDMMSDDEVRGVLGHELGHVALGHSKKAMQVAYAATAARSAVGATNGAMAALSSSQLGELGEKLVNAQFSQAQETAADDFAFDLLTKNKANTKALVTAFEKLAKLDGGKSSMFGSHPGSEARAKHIEGRISKVASK
ncbi:putative metalloprotease [Cupriavidus sp. OV038]|uniref:metalloprotease LoiP n=1 Tax=unclassified Cupriavidus TaxID=2640874 RepID=UPI0008DFBFB9|nr:MULTISPECIES: M48 family metallopeptidase [unclassified Cupriavidus]SFD38191.1 putative metalloprotease [Cupriavidus sp. OV038]SFQ08302.1 putative metalloprotease [Cupriavidus sp. OV096]